MVCQAGASMAHIQLQEMQSGSKGSAPYMELQLPPTLSWPVLGLIFWVRSLESRSKSEHPNALHYTSVYPSPKPSLVVKQLLQHCCLLSESMFPVRIVAPCLLLLLAVHTTFGLFSLCSIWPIHQLHKHVPVWMPVHCWELYSNCRCCTLTMRWGMPVKKSQCAYLPISLCFQHNCCQFPMLLHLLFAQAVQQESCLERNLVAGVPSSAAMVSQQGTRSSLARRHGQACAASAGRKYHFTSLLPSVFQLWLSRGLKNKSQCFWRPGFGILLSFKCLERGRESHAVGEGIAQEWGTLRTTCFSWRSWLR